MSPDSGVHRSGLRPLDLCRMTPLRVSDAIQSAAGLCGELAAQFDASAPSISGSPSQPSAAAITAGHAAVQAAEAAMNGRLEATGTKIFEAAASYTEQDARSASALGEQVV